MSNKIAVGEGRTLCFLRVIAVRTMHLLRSSSRKSFLILTTCAFVIVACDPPPAPQEKQADTGTLKADTAHLTPTVPPPALSLKDSLVMVEQMVVRMKRELLQAQQALAEAEKRRKALSNSKGGQAEQRAREIRDASIAAELNKDMVERSRMHLSELERTKARLEAAVRDAAAHAGH